MLVPAPRAGAKVAAARRMRVFVDGDELVLTHPDGHREVLCPKAEVRRIIHVTRESADEVWLDHAVILGRGRAWALPLAAWTPGGIWQLVQPRRDGLAKAGVIGLGAALGVRIVLTGAEAGATLADVVGLTAPPAGGGSAGGVRVLDPRGAGLPWWLAVIRWSGLGLAAVAALVLGGARLWQTAYGRPEEAWGSRGGPVVWFAWMVVWVPWAWLSASAVAWWRRQEARDRGPDPWQERAEAVWRPRPVGGVPRRLLRQARLLVTETELCVRNGYRWESWLPGPACAGVSEALLVTDPDPSPASNPSGRARGRGRALPGRGRVRRRTGGPASTRTRSDRAQGGRAHGGGAGAGQVPDQLHLVHAEGATVGVLPLRAWAGTSQDLQLLVQRLTAVGIRVRPAPPGTTVRREPDGLGARPMNRLAVSNDPDSGLAEQDVLAPVLYLAVDAFAWPGVTSPLARALMLAPFVPYAIVLAWKVWLVWWLDRIVTAPRPAPGPRETA